MRKKILIISCLVVSIVVIGISSLIIIDNKINKELEINNNNDNSNSNGIENLGTNDPDLNNNDLKVEEKQEENINNQSTQNSNQNNQSDNKNTQNNQTSNDSNNGTNNNTNSNPKPTPIPPTDSEFEELKNNDNKYKNLKSSVTHNTKSQCNEAGFSISFANPIDIVGFYCDEVIYNADLEIIKDGVTYKKHFEEIVGYTLKFNYKNN